MVEAAQGLREMVGGERSDGTGVEFKYFVRFGWVRNFTCGVLGQRRFGT